MNELRERIQFLSNCLIPKEGYKMSFPSIEELLWDLVEQAMKVQQQINGGHK